MDPWKMMVLDKPVVFKVHVSLQRGTKYIICKFICVYRHIYFLACSYVLVYACIPFTYIYLYTCIYIHKNMYQQTNYIYIFHEDRQRCGFPSRGAYVQLWLDG